jgi:hypothetical protein
MLQSRRMVEGIYPSFRIPDGHGMRLGPEVP